MSMIYSGDEEYGDEITSGLDPSVEPLCPHGNIRPCAECDDECPEED